MTTLRAGFRVISYVASNADAAPPHLSSSATLLDSKGVVICYVHAPTTTLAGEKLERWVEAGAKKERGRRERAEATGARIRAAAEARRSSQERSA